MQEFCPVLDPARTEFGFGRTACACPDCAAGAASAGLPRSLADLGPAADHLAPGPDLQVWARSTCWPHRGRWWPRPPGSSAFSRCAGATTDGACRFLTDEGVARPSIRQAPTDAVS